MAGKMVFPAFVDMHASRQGPYLAARGEPDGTFEGALATVGADRVANWSAEDVRARMEFALRCAWAHGTRGVAPISTASRRRDAISFPVFAELREDWAGRIALQGSCLVPIDMVEEGDPFGRTAAIVERAGGVLGAVTYPVPDLRRRLRVFFDHAARRGLQADFHVDETGDASVATLKVIAEVALEMGFDAPVTVGHCCSLAVQPEASGAHARPRGQGRAECRQPADVQHVPAGPHARPHAARRGVTLVHEMAARGISVNFASDNTRDPFYAMAIST